MMLAKWVNAFRLYTFPQGVMLDAVKRGDVQTVKWLHIMSMYEPQRALRLAAKRGHLEVVQWFADNASSALHADPSRITIEVEVPLRESLEMIVWAST